MYVASHADHRCTRSEISDYFNLSEEHLRKVIHNLSQWGYLNTFSGRNGGFEMAKALKNINLGQLIRKTENQITMFDCESQDCRLLPSCSLNKVLHQAQLAFFNTLDKLMNDKKTLQLLKS